MDGGPDKKFSISARVIGLIFQHSTLKRSKFSGIKRNLRLIEKMQISHRRRIPSCAYLLLILRDKKINQYFESRLIEAVVTTQKQGRSPAPERFPTFVL